MWTLAGPKSTCDPGRGWAKSGAEVGGTAFRAGRDQSGVANAGSRRGLQTEQVGHEELAPAHELHLPTNGGCNGVAVPNQPVVDFGTDPAQ